MSQIIRFNMPSLRNNSFALLRHSLIVHILTCIDMFGNGIKAFLVV